MSRFIPGKRAIGSWSFDIHKITVQSNQLRQMSTSQKNLGVIRSETKLSTRENTILKYDPTDEISDFTSFGILPFLQEKLNSFLLPDKTRKTSSPDFNITPTLEQRALLSILNSDHSIIMKSFIHSGKSLSVMLYALNLSLSRVPNFGILKKSPTLDSIILVPTDALIDKYKGYIELLTKDIPELCCPHEILSSGDSKTEFQVTRRPLLVEFIYSSQKTSLLKTGPEHSNEAPHILITTPTQLYNIINGDEPSSSLSSKKNLSEVRFVAVDGMDYFTSSTDIGNNYNIVRVGKKAKYGNVLENSIQKLQNFQIKFHQDNLLKRLKVIEKAYRKFNDKVFLDNTFDHAELAFQNNDLSIASVDEFISSKYSRVIESERPNPTLLKRLVKHKRKVLYKPIQYCFLCNPQHPYQEEIQHLVFKNSSNKVQNSTLKQMQMEMPSSNSNHQLHNLYSAYLSEREKKIEERDFQTSIIEKMIQYDDIKREYRNQERKILNVGSFNLSNNLSLKSVHTHFLDASEPEKGTIIMRDIDLNMPNKLSAIKILENDVVSCGFNLKNIMKLYLKAKMTRVLNNKFSRNNINSALIEKAMNTFRKEYPLNTSSFIVVIPPYVNRNKVVKILNSKDSLDKFTCSDRYCESDDFLPKDTKEYEVRKNLILHPDQLVGRNFKNFSNLLVVGIDCLLNQLALSTWNIKKYENLKQDITGLENPSADLFYFYISKIIGSSNNDTKNFVFVLDSTNNQCSDIDSKRLSQIILYNDIPGVLNVSKLLDESKEAKQLSHGIDKQYLENTRKEMIKSICK